MTSPARECAAIVILLALAACSHGATTAPKSSGGENAVENGRLIFQTGKDYQGVQIVAQPPALYPRCAACHRANGAGGMHFPDGAVSADLRHSALAQPPHPYTLRLLERAISTGIDNDGKPLDKVMPHWKLSARDLHDVSAYVLTLK